MSNNSVLLTTFKGSTAHIVLNRPDRLNAVNVSMVEELHRSLDQIEGLPDIAAVSIVGSGQAFCAGADVKDMEGRPSRRDLPTDVLDKARNAERIRMTRAFDVVVRLSELPKATFAGLRGPVAGAGIGIALACDFRIAAESTIFVPGFSKLGLPGDWGVTWLLNDKGGRNVARRMLLSGERIDAQNALAAGIVDEIVPDDELVDVLDARLRTSIPVSVRALAESKALLARDGLRSAVLREIDATLACQETYAHTAALKAFALRGSKPLPTTPDGSPVQSSSLSS